MNQTIDPHLRRWMLFVDGENFTARFQEIAKNHAVGLEEGKYYRKDTFVWYPDRNARMALTNSKDPPLKVEAKAIRAFYYTSVTGGSENQGEVEAALWDMGFQPRVFHKDSRGQKSKGVDIRLTTDLLSNAFQDNYDVAVVISGDADYAPVFEEVKRLGKVVFLAFFANNGLSPKLKLTADAFWECEQPFIELWQEFVTKGSSITTKDA